MRLCRKQGEHSTRRRRPLRQVRDTGGSWFSDRPLARPRETGNSRCLLRTDLPASRRLLRDGADAVDHVRSPFQVDRRASRKLSHQQMRTSSTCATPRLRTLTRHRSPSSHSPSSPFRLLPISCPAKPAAHAGFGLGSRRWIALCWTGPVASAERRSSSRTGTGRTSSRARDTSSWLRPSTSSNRIRHDWRGLDALSQPGDASRPCGISGFERSRKTPARSFKDGRHGGSVFSARVSRTWMMGA